MAAIIAVKSAGGGYTCKVPLDLLAQDGVPPEQGDSVSYSVEGTVQSTDAEDATVKITSVNGEPVDESASDEAAEDQGATPDTGLSSGGGPSTASMGAALRAGAKGKPLPF
jgi:hypothetical protein